MKNRPVVPDNEDHWQVFDNDKHIEYFLQSKNEFAIASPSFSHEKECLNGEPIPETGSSSPTDINQFDHLFKEKLSDDPNQKDLEVL